MIIFVLSALFLRSMLGGVFVLTPLLLAMIVNLGIMGWAGMWLDMSTAAMSAMGISIGADFGIYLIFRMREEWSESHSLESAIAKSMITSGQAICYVSLAVATGYMILPLARFSIWTRLGILTASGVCISALATLTIIPAAALLLRPGFICLLRRVDSTPLVEKIHVHEVLRNRMVSVDRVIPSRILKKVLR